MNEFCPSKKCNVMELLPFFLDIPMESADVHVSPSRLLSELQMSMQKRFEQLTRPTRKRRIITESNTFIRNPDIVVFQNYEAYQTYKTSLTFVNTKTASKNLRLSMDFKTPFFEIVRPPSDLDFTKVAPGIAYTITIVFKPSKMNDYVTNLICDTNEETIVVPIYGLGTRPLLNIVDEIILNPTAIRITSEKSILFHNLGKTPGHYIISVDEPFYIETKKGVVDANQVHELKISCTPIMANDSKSDVVIVCDDITLKIPIICEIEEADIYLQKQSVEFLEVYVGLQHYKTATFCNTSPFTIDFRWKLLSSEKEDIEKINKFLENMEELHEQEKLRYAKLKYHDVIDDQGHQQILDYKFRETAESINDEFKLMFTSDAFNIIPLEGKILPNQCFDFTVIFSPTKNEVYLNSAYLDVTGKQERFRLYLSGIGRGPSVVFNVNKVNTGTIFLDAVHEYQVVVKNEGCIPATVSFQKKDTEFGGEIGCSPSAQYLKRIDTCKTFIVTFTSCIQGPFIEKVYFKIRESNELIYFLLIGNVVCPLLIPDVDKLDFGKISYGTEITKSIVLTNPSQVPIDYQIKMSKINYVEVIRDGKKEKKADFTYQPESGIVAPYANVSIEINLLTNVIDNVKEFVIVKMYNSDLYNVQIPCTYTCLIPTIKCDPEDIYITFCFLNFVYKRTLTFTNTTIITGQLKYTPLEDPKNMNISLSPTEISITPHGVFEIELTITTDVLGLHEYPLMFTLVGQDKPTRWCNLKCNGQGPVISYYPDDIHFGKVQLLTKQVRKVSFVNDSPIKARIFLSTDNRSVLQLPVEELKLYPECEIDVDVICFLTQDGKFNCNLFIDIENGENIIINVSGEGIGYPILCEPNLEPVYDMGAHLIHLNNKLTVQISNLGKRFYRIYLSRKPIIRNLKDLLDEAEYPCPPKSVFCIEPNYLELGENCTEEIDIYACSKIQQYYEENFYMHATVDNNTTTSCTIMSILLKIKFTTPQMSFSTTNLNFMDLHVPETIDPLCDLNDLEKPLKSISTGQVTIKNEVEIPLNLMMQTTSDFYIKCEEDELAVICYYNLEVGKEITVELQYKPTQWSKRYMKQLGKLTVNIPNYPKTESIFLTGEMCFPSIQFLPSEIDFGCLAIGSCINKNIIIQNITFLPVKYTLELSMDSFEMETLPIKDDISDGSTFDAESMGAGSVFTEKSSFLKVINPEVSVNVTEPDTKKVEIQEVTFQPKRRSTFSSYRDKKMESITGDDVIVFQKPSVRLDESYIKSPSEQLMIETTYTSQDMLIKPVELDGAKVQKAVKDVLNNFLYCKHEYADSTEIKSRDFWTGIKDSEKNNLPSLRTIVTMEPWKGCLQPYEYGIINVSFHPPPNTSIQCTAICKIEGGENEPIAISGSCAGIAFSFNKTFIDVGRKLFCEVFKTMITITNDGYYEFPVKVRCDSEEIFYNKKIKSRWLNVYPRKFYLDAGRSVTFEISYFPGLTGPFEEDIIFDVAYLDPIKIPLTGYAVFSQICLSIPKMELHSRHRCITYQGIASLTDKFLLSQVVVARKKSSISFLKYDKKAVIYEDRNDVRFQCLLDDDWVIIFRDDLVPTAQELDLAVERTILNEYLYTHTEELKRHSITKKYKIIPDFKVPPYRLAFGNVIFDTPVCLTVYITNVGPEPASIKLVKDNLAALHNNDLSIEFRPKTLDVGESTHMQVLLKPTLKHKTEYDDKCIRDVMYLVVTHGATIPIVITATVALPRFNFLYKCIDFGMIKVGNAFRHTVVIDNSGCLPSIWETEVISSNHMKPSYYVIPSKGELAAFDKGVINIYFVPEKKGFYPSELLVHVQGSFQQVRLKMCGDGVQPTLVFKDANVKFRPCIPYTTENVKELLIQNVSTYPIEFCFSDFERLYDEEKMLVDMFLNHYNLKTAFIPERELGGGIPDILTKTYHMLELELRKLIRSGLSEDATDTSVLVGCSREQIVEMINKHINSLDTIGIMENTTDVYVKEDSSIEGLAIIDPPKTDNQGTRKGVVFIFHGGPKTNYVRAAFETKKSLKSELTNIDRLICTELIEKNNPISLILNNCIDEALNLYDEIIKIEPWDDEYDVLYKKIDIILNSKLSTKKKGIKEDKSQEKESDQETSRTENSKTSLQLSIPLRTPKGKKGGETLLDFSPEIFAELLKPKFEELQSALVIESLDSIFIWKPLICFEILLHAIGNMRYIHVVLMSLTSHEYIAMESQKIFEQQEQPNVFEDILFSQKPTATKTSEHIMKSKEKKELHSGTSKSTKDDNKLNDNKNNESKGLSAIMKQVAKDVPKELDQKFKAFANLLTDITEVCANWDRSQSALALMTSTTHTKSDKKAKKQAATIILNFTNTLRVTDLERVGIPLMIMDNASSDKYELEETINNTLLKSPELKKAIRDLKCGSQIIVQESKFMYSILRSNTRFNKNLSDVFNITNPAKEKDKIADAHDVVNVALSPVQSTVKTNKSKKKKTTSSIKSEPFSIISRIDKPIVDPFCARTVINAGEILKFEVSFLPQNFGVFSHKYRMEIIGYRPPLFLKCSAICELPKLDYTPEIMFSNCLESVQEKKVDDKFVYLKDKKILDFGTLLVGSAKIPPYSTKIFLSNISKITCHTFIILAEDSEFSVKPTEVQIGPKKEVELEVSLQGRKKGIFDSNLYITIKNNPRVYRLRLYAKVSPLDFGINPKFLNFDKIPVDYPVKQYIKLTNSTLIKLKWRFTRCDWATRIYKISKFAGEIDVNSLDRVEVEFKPTKEEIFPPRIIEIQVFDPLCSEDVPFLIDTITLQSESLAYVVDYTDHVDLGDIKGKIEYTFPLKLYNNGKTNIHMILEKLVDHPESKYQKVRRLFSLNFNSEILQPQKNTGIEIKVLSLEEIEFQHIPVFVCKFLDPNKPQNVIKSFQIKYSATVLLSKFSLCPASGVHFGPLELQNTRSQIIKLKNTGKCNFQYFISYLDPSVKSVPLVVSSIQSRQGKFPKTTNKMKAMQVLAPTTLELPSYTIFPANGILGVGESADIKVTFHPNLLGVYKETVVLNVSEPVKEHAFGKKIILYGEASEPKIEFDVSKMFKEHYIVDNIDELIVPSDIGTHTYYVTSKNTLYFENVCVKKKCHGKIYLQNSGQMVAVLATKVYNSSHFTVAPTQITIEPYCTTFVTVTFKPDSINTFDGKLEITSNATTNNVFELTLLGRSYVPQINLSGLPLSKGDEHVYKIFLKPIYIHEIQTHKVEIKNTGVITCQVIVDVTDSGDSMFYLLHGDQSPELTKEGNNLVASSLKVKIKPSQSTDVYVVFKPNKEAIIDSTINIYLVDNPFETNKIQVFGHCYIGDIYIETLEAFNPKGWSSKTNEIAYILNFGHTPLKLLEKKRFTITNNSLNNLYRFEFKYYVDSLRFIPRVGHLKPMSSKEILAINMSDTPNTVIKDLVIFNYIPIEIVNEQPIPIAWDERQQLLSWIEDGMQYIEDHSMLQHFTECVEAATDAYLKTEHCDRLEVKDKLKLSLEREEPELKYNAEIWQSIDIFLSFTTDYAFYASTTTELNFPETFVKNKSELTFEIKNCGRVPIHIEWQIQYGEFFPKSPSFEIKKEPETEEFPLVDTASLDDSCGASTSFSAYDSSMVAVHPSLFMIIPKKTVIPVNKNGEFTVIFSPLIACQYTAHLLSDIEAIHPDLNNMEILITADSEVPDYYFELEESDYLKRRTLTRCVKSIDDNLKILEIYGVGVGITTIKRFCVINTSIFPLNFKLEPIEQGRLSYFQCKTPSGNIQRGKKFELVFAFSSQEIGTFEEDYIFSTEELKPEIIDDELKVTATKFLIVGICTNPRVYFKVPHLNLMPTLLRVPTQETIFLKNEENEDLGFKILKKGLYSDDHLQKLKIIPIFGIVPAKSEFPLQLKYNAEAVEDSNFCIQCVVDRMSAALTLNVSTKCLEVECKILYIDPSGEEIILDPNNENIINIGKIGVKTKLIVPFLFTNNGKTGFFYTWHYNKSHIEHLINISPKKDKEFLASGSTVKREITFETFKKYNLVKFPMKIEISYGPIYNLKFNVAAEFPLCKLSFTNYNFGNCLIQQGPTKNYLAPLVVKNLEPHAVKFDNLFEENENLTIDFKSELIQPKCTKTIPFYFHPRKEGEYEFLAPLVLNCTRRLLKISGTGVKINLQLLRPSDKFIDLGEVKIGDSKKRRIFVINKTPAQFETTLFLSQDFPVEDKEEEKLKPEIVVPDIRTRASTMKTKKSTVQIEKTPKSDFKETGRNKMNKEETMSVRVTINEEQSGMVDPQPSEYNKKPNFFIEPKYPVKMDFNKKYEYVVEFRPNERLENFKQQIFYKIQDYVAPLALVRGKCLVPEFSLDKEILTFSNVLVDTTRVKYILLRNTGDLPLKFKWQNDYFKYFKVHPVEGHVNPKSDIKVDFSFKISTVECQIVKKCKCIINNNYTLELTLAANSVKPPPVATIIFSCPVRQTIIENVNIINKTKTLWNPRPIISNKNFKIPPEIIVEPESVSAVPVEYHPKQIIDEEATLILPLPDEEIVYELIGQPLPPLPEKRLTIEIRSKQNYCQILPIRNWSDVKRCFEVETQLISVPTSKTLYKTFGFNLIHLLSREIKDYKWNIYAIHEEPLEFNVIFKDKQSNEYMFFEILVKVLPPEPIDCIRLETCVRQPIKTRIKLKNPINIPVEFCITCPNPELQFRNFVPMQPYTTYDLEVTYFPVKCGDCVTSIDAKCDELGVFSYAMYLEADMPSVEKVVKFVVDLGSKGYATVDIINTFSSNLEMSVKFDDPEYSVEKFIKTILPEETTTFSITFEPSEIGVLESRLQISSPVSGPYIFPLYGECVAPTPKGPFHVKPGSTTSIQFFNPFKEPQVFFYSCDSDKFEVKVLSEEIKGRKSIKIPVCCTQTKDETLACPHMGRLIVSCGDIKWSFYLQTE